MLELTAELSRSLDEAAALILRSKHVVALAGAGLSVESGIPPYRGPGGLWTKHGEPTNLSYKEFIQDPGGWWEARFRNEDKPGDPTYEMKMAVDQAEPNPGHHALVEMEEMGLLRCVVTQNVDNPPPGGGQPFAAGDSRQPDLAPVPRLWRAAAQRRLSFR